MASPMWNTRSICARSGDASVTRESSMLHVVLWACLVVLSACGESPPSVAPDSVEGRMAALTRLGLQLAPGTSIESLMEEHGRESMERSWLDLLYAIEFDDQVASWQEGSLNVWILDAECIENDGDYIRIAKGFEVMSGGALVFENLRDSVDFESNKASLSFRLGGKDHAWDITLEDDWLDPEVFGELSRIFEEKGRGRVMKPHNLGQASLWVAGPPDKVAAFEDLTGLTFLD